jgi:hypothetical protein
MASMKHVAPVPPPPVRVQTGPDEKPEPGFVRRSEETTPVKLALQAAPVPPPPENVHDGALVYPSPVFTV